jgi:hypothetical protein
MAESILFRTPADAVQEEQAKVWADLKALKM